MTQVLPLMVTRNITQNSLDESCSWKVISDTLTSGKSIAKINFERRMPEASIIDPKSLFQQLAVEGGERVRVTCLWEFEHSWGLRELNYKY